ncbi:MAG: M20 metallopeptidase family protein, partial [Oscillospiraceae bacterium]
MDIQELRREAQTMQPQLTADRRRLHQNPEAGAVLPETVAYVKGRLTEMGYHPQALGGGLTATVTGTDTGRCILLRADMDALRGQEQSGLSFRSENGCMHACGHDMHTAMMLGAAQLLMQRRQELSGTVKLVFQPDEEGFTGAKSMLAAGSASSAPARRWPHVHSGTLRNGAVRQRDLHGGLYPVPYHGAGKPPRGHAGDGRGPHRHRRPDLAGPQEITGRELPAKTPAVVTVGRFQAGQAPNIIPDEAVLEGTVRTFDRAVTARIMERIRQLSEGIASAFRGSAQMEELASAPPLQNDPALVEDMATLAETLLGREKVYRLKEGGMGSEDFASYTYELPCAYLL